jgi:hypothetical protein
MIELSGVVLNQNGTNSGTEVLFGDFIYENFHLPADYKRAGVKSPQVDRILDLRDGHRRCLRVRLDRRVP